MQEARGKLAHSWSVIYVLCSHLSRIGLLTLDGVACEVRHEALVDVDRSYVFICSDSF